jgi:hypothetical protein
MATATMAMDPIIGVFNGNAIVFERTNKPRATTLKGKLSAEVKFCPEIELRKNIRRKVKRTKAILGNGEDHCGATAQWNALAVGWGDKDVRTDEATKGDGWRNLMKVTSSGCREERLHAYHIGQRLAIFWHLF